MKGLITLCARGGSKGIPGKNIKLLNGKPLISYSIEVALQFAKLHGWDVFLSTDSQEIIDVVESISTEVETTYKRPKSLGSDTAGKLDVIKDVLLYAEEKSMLSYDFVLDLDVTSPLRTVEDLEGAFEKLLANESSMNIFSVSPANRNPYFNMVEENNEGAVTLCKEGHFLTRQSAPKVYDLNASFYIYKRCFFNQNTMKVIDNKCLIFEVPHICFDLDHSIDFDFMAYLLKERKLDFSFPY